MVPLMSLWLPILLSAVLVFVASSIIHMFLPYHKNDFGKVPSEDEVMAALGRFSIPPGEYMIPRPGSPEAMKSPEFIEKVKRGPVAMLTVMPPIPSGTPSMTSNLIQWFIYCVVVSIFAGYVASRAVGPGAEYLTVFRFAGTVAFAGYTLALYQQSIWYHHAWSTALKQTFDGLVYGLLTAGAFGWLWPT